MRTSWITRKVEYIAIITVLSLSACDSKNDPTPATHAIDATKKAISLAELQNKAADYRDREVTVAAYLFTHEEGPWIGAELKSPLKNTMHLVVSESSRIIPEDQTHFRIWYEWKEGFPALITGTLRIGDLKIAHGTTLKNQP
jgi:hypothetical protein